MTGPSSTRTVSVIIPLHNHAHTIAATIDSVLHQRDLPDDVAIEVVVVDDASTDGGADLLDGSGVAIVRRSEQRGAAAARNLGFERSSGQFLVFLDSDDLIPPQRIAHQLAVLSAQRDNDAVGGQIVEFADEGYTPPRALRPAMATLMVGALLIRREAFQRVGLFDEQITGREVVEWGSRLRRSGAVVAPLDEVVLHRRLHAKNHGLDGAHAASLLQAVRQHVIARKPTDGTTEPG